MSAQRRVGVGYDRHRLAEGRRLVLGGVEVPHERGLDGHSDADVLTHAVIDALLGAAGVGDIGQLFPDTDPAFAGADSLGLLREVLARLAADGWRPEHVDATLLLERPKLGPARAEIRRSLAAALGLAEEAVTIKATTGERIGFVGREEGAAALAAATLVRRAPRARTTGINPLEDRFGYARAVRAGDRVLVSGCAPVWPDGSCPGDPAVQARRCFEIGLAALADLGATADDVVRTRMYVTDAAFSEAVGLAHAEAVGAARPATSMLVVAALLDPRWRVEVELEAETG